MEPETPITSIISSPKEPERKLFYSFVQLDPRPGQTNPAYCLGIEITDPKLLKGGTLNLDHHGEGTTADMPSACEQALICDLPDGGTAIATIRVDKDSLAAMAVLESKKAGRPINVALVHAVGAVDRYGPKVTGQYEEFSPLIIALDRQSANFKLSLAEKVQFAQQVLDGTVDMSKVMEMITAHNMEFDQAKAASKVTEIIPGRLALVVSESRFATNLGYELAPTIIAFNPRMPVMARTEDGSLKPTDETFAKFTIARYDDHVPTDINAITDALRRAEAKARGVPVEELKNNWGGRGDIIGFPQNESSELTVDEVVNVVKEHMANGKLFKKGDDVVEKKVDTGVYEKPSQETEITQDEKVLLLKTIKDFAQIFNAQGLDYQIVGGVSVDLLAESLGIKPMKLKPKDIDVVTFGAKPIEALLKAGYKMHSPSWTPIYEILYDALYSYYGTSDPKTRVSIDLFVKKGGNLPSVPTRTFIIKINGVDVKLGSPADSYLLTGETIENFKEKGYKPRPEDLRRLKKLEKILDLIGGKDQSKIEFLEFQI